MSTPCTRSLYVSLLATFLVLTAAPRATAQSTLRFHRQPTGPSSPPPQVIELTIHEAASPADLARAEPEVTRSPLGAVDGNLERSILRHVTRRVAFHDERTAPGGGDHEGADEHWPVRDVHRIAMPDPEEKTVDTQGPKAQTAPPPTDEHGWYVLPAQPWGGDLLFLHTQHACPQYEDNPWAEYCAERRNARHGQVRIRPRGPVSSCHGGGCCGWGRKPCSWHEGCDAAAPIPASDRDGSPPPAEDNVMTPSPRRHPQPATPTNDAPPTWPKPPRNPAPQAAASH